MLNKNVDYVHSMVPCILYFNAHQKQMIRI